MKMVLLIVGIVVLAVGLLGALYAFAVASGVQTEYDFFCPSGQMPPSFCAALLSSVATYRTLTLAMGVIAAFGLIVAIAALAMKGPLMPPSPAFAPMYPPPMPPSGAMTSRTCSACGRTNLGTDRFCSGCGAPLS